jgi:hypothetical protein
LAEASDKTPAEVTPTPGDASESPDTEAAATVPAAIRNSRREKRWCI